MRHKQRISVLKQKTREKVDSVHRETRHVLNRAWQVGFGIVWFLLNFLLFPALAHAVTYPTPTGYVNDFAQIISPQTETQLEERLKSYDQQTSNEIAVVTIKSLENEPIEDYAVTLFERWRVGKEKKDNGVMFLVSKDDRKMRIEVGYGLEGSLTDGEAGSIIRNDVAPKFRENDFDGGITNGVNGIIAGIGSPESDWDKAVGNNPVREKGGGAFDNLISLLGEYIFFIPFGLIYLSSYMARTKDITLGGILGGIGGGIVGSLLGSTAALIGLGVGGAVFGLIVDWILSRNYKALSRQGYPTDWFHTYGGFGGRSGWGGGSRGGGFGGFGGGRSGGGGASGGW